MLAPDGANDAGNDRCGDFNQRDRRRRAGGANAGRLGMNGRRRRGGRSVRGAPAGFQLFGQNRRRLPQTRQRRPRGSRRIPCGLRNGRHRALYRRHGIRRDLNLVSIGELRLPDPAATVATKLPGPAAGRPQACHCDAIGCSAVVGADGEHMNRQAQGRRGTLALGPQQRSIKGWETKPVWPVRHAQRALARFRC